MTQRSRPTDSPQPDELEQQIARALHSRAATAPEADVIAARIEARLAGSSARPTPSSPSRRGGRIVATGVVASTLALGAAGAAAAANPYSGVARVVENVVQSVGIPWSPMPDGYTREQYDAFWESGYAFEDAELLAEQWQVDMTTAKARVGQMILDETPLPVAPARPPDPYEAHAPQIEAFWDAGYDVEDIDALRELWNIEAMDVKARAGQMLLDGEPLPHE